MPEPSREELMSALFQGMVLQQANMALMCLGKMPHPQTGQTGRDLEAARFFIDQLEMIEVKTKGNLSQEEERFLKQSLTDLRMAFVEAIGEAPAAAAPEAAASSPGPRSGTGSAEPPSPTPAESEAESRKKFSKKY